MSTKCILILIFISCTQGAKHLRQVPVAVAPPGNGYNEADYRLPGDVIPHDYSITLTPNFEDFTFDGEVKITISANNPTDKIVLHYNLINVTNTTLTDTEGNGVNIKDETYKEELNFYTITLDENLNTEVNYILDIQYTGLLLTDMIGFYRTSYGTGDDIRWLASTQFEPVGARRAFPCFDEPKYKATFQINIIRDDKRTSISNTLLRETIPIDTQNKTFMDIFETTKEMSTYLVAFIVSDFDHLNKTGKDGREYSVWAEPRLIEDANFSLQIGMDVIDYMESFTDIKYEYTKMDQAAIPDFSAGAMENWGLVTYRERLMLVNHKRASALNMKQVATVISHEFAHQWFGDLVSPEWWKYIWLNEGFATYFEYFGIHGIKPEWRLDEQFVVDMVQNALAVDAVSSSHPITTDVYTPSQIQGNFDNIVYDKAGSVLRSVEHFLTAETFKKAIREYLNNHNHSVATANDLFEAFEKQQQLDKVLDSDLNATEILISWTEQAGYPVITVTKDSENKAYSISQSQFLISGSNTSDTTWFVPLTYTTSADLIFNDTKPKQWLKKGTKEDKIDLEVPDDQWIIFNILSTGFYRVLYDENNYKLLTNYLKSDKFEKIAPINRAQLIDDSLNLARAGLLDYNIALDLTEYLVKETDYIPWASFFSAVSFLKNRLIGTDLYGNFKVYLGSLIDKLYKEYSDFEIKASDTQTDILNRMNFLKWACEIDYDTCNEKAVNLIGGHTDTIHPDLMSVVYCYGIRQQDKGVWGEIWTEYNINLNPYEKSVLLSALGCTKDTDSLNELLTNSIKGTNVIRMQDSATVFAAVYRKPEGLEVALDFLDSHFEEMKSFYLSMNGISQILTGIASQISTQEQKKKFESFYNKHKDDLGDLEYAAKSGLSTIENNLNWFETNREIFEKWFAKYPVPPTTTEPTTTEPTTTEPTTTEPTTTDGVSPMATSLPLIVTLIYSILALY